MQDAILGQYWAADSPIHDMDPRIKITAMFVMMVIIFCAGNYLSLAVCAAFVVAFFAVANIPAKQMMRSIGPLMFIVVITAILNLFFVQGGTVYFQAGPLVISQAGVHSAVFLCFRLTVLLLSVSLLTLTTTSLDITDATEAMLKPFVRFGMPAHEFAMVMGIALRFLPQFVSEFRTIHASQVSRGASITTNPFRGGWSSLTSLIVPLFTSAFRHADTMSAAMDARCYHGGNKTKLNPLHYTNLDWIGLGVLAVMAVCVVAANILV